MVCSMAPLRCPETCLVDTKGLHLVVNVVPNFLKLVFQVTDHILGPPHGFPKSSLRLLQCFFLLLQKNLSRVSLLLTQRTPLTSRQTPKAKLYHGVFSLVCCMEHRQRMLRLLDGIIQTLGTTLQTVNKARGVCHLLLQGPRQIAVPPELLAMILMV